MIFLSIKTEKAAPRYSKSLSLYDDYTKASPGKQETERQEWRVKG
jgi:hypothetical protein